MSPIRSALITRRRLADIYVLLVVLFSVAAIFWIFGYLVGSSYRPQVYRCPTVKGGTVVSSYDGKTGTGCVYVSGASYGKAKLAVRLD